MSLIIKIQWWDRVEFFEKEEHDGKQCHLRIHLCF